MVTLALTVFVCTCLALITLFVLKIRELQTGVVWYASQRHVLDQYALRLKHEVTELESRLMQLSPLVGKLTTVCIHTCALGIAAGARVIERTAHAVADMASHKHAIAHGKKLPTSSDFLRQVGEYKDVSRTEQ